jgi:Mg/Co/Ni transporter MgtE
MVCSGPDIDQEKIDQLLNAMVEAKRKAGERADNVDPRVFGKFIRDKTRQVKKSLQCDKVLFTIVVEGGKVRLKASRAS